jgi:hypothetical protein
MAALAARCLSVLVALAGLEERQIKAIQRRIVLLAMAVVAAVERVATVRLVGLAAITRAAAAQPLARLGPQGLGALLAAVAVPLGLMFQRPTHKNLALVRVAVAAGQALKEQGQAGLLRLGQRITPITQK